MRKISNSYSAREFPRYLNTSSINSAEIPERAWRSRCRKNWSQFLAPPLMPPSMKWNGLNLRTLPPSLLCFFFSYLLTLSAFPSLTRISSFKFQPALFRRDCLEVLFGFCCFFIWNFTNILNIEIHWLPCGKLTYKHYTKPNVIIDTNLTHINKI